MIEIKNVEVSNFKNAIRGARNPLNSWDKMDSYEDESGNFVMGENDMQLCCKLCKAGSDHRKFIRQIFVSMDITAPLYWWKEFDTYKVGTVANSTSTMHKIHSKEIELDDFSYDRLGEESIKVFNDFVGYIENKRKKYVESKDKKDWDEIIQLLPSSYNQMRTCTMNYENLINMYQSRKNHKLKEWREFCQKIEDMPYFVDMFGIETQKEEIEK